MHKGIKILTEKEEKEYTDGYKAGLNNVDLSFRKYATSHYYLKGWDDARDELFKKELELLRKKSKKL